MKSIIADVLRQVAELYNIDPNAITARNRTKQVVAARHAFIWTVNQVRPELTRQELAELAGLDDHTSVVYALAKMRATLATRRDLYDQLLEIGRRAVRGQQKPTTRQPDPAAVPQFAPDAWAIAIARRYGVQTAISA